MSAPLTRTLPNILLPSRACAAMSEVVPSREPCDSQGSTKWHCRGQRPCSAEVLYNTVGDTAIDFRLPVADLGVVQLHYQRSRVHYLLDSTEADSTSSRALRVHLPTGFWECSSFARRHELPHATSRTSLELPDPACTCRRGHNDSLRLRSVVMFPRWIPAVGRSYLLRASGRITSAPGHVALADKELPGRLRWAVALFLGAFQGLHNVCSMEQMMDMQRQQ
ncbi:hypothetical protein C8T65DRAFT_703595 [Cerioporus squamosus]|nr:hypothetical protein C8T65DRAFT_703595 [Cerioporus squamosus]